MGEKYKREAQKVKRRAERNIVLEIFPLDIFKIILIILHKKEVKWNFNTNGKIYLKLDV